MMERPSLTLGIEEEYQIVDPETRELRAHITNLIDGDRMILIEREVKPELHQSMVELGTPVCHTVEQAKEELIKQRKFICDLAENRAASPLWRPRPTPLANGANSRSRPSRAIWACWKRCKCWPSACSSSACTCM